MKRVTHERKRAKARHWLEPLALFFTGAALVTTSTGCDIVQGYQDAGDAISPNKVRISRLQGCAS